MTKETGKWLDDAGLDPRYPLWHQADPEGEHADRSLPPPLPFDSPEDAAQSLLAKSMEWYSATNPTVRAFESDCADRVLRVFRGGLRRLPWSRGSGDPVVDCLRVLRRWAQATAATFRRLIRRRDYSSSARSVRLMAALSTHQ
ncbi:MAG: hypothetical protein CM15mP89_5730 [Gammaproteobacteria bacterium]|nr:MAG: hypothetical protein CM15mP89_5730 [Gammaproteobacteria bacterium]